MQIRLLDAAGARQLYESRMARDFPPGELKPFAAVEELLTAGLYEPLTFTDDALREVARLTLKRETGARGLRSVMEGLLTQLMFDIPSDPTVTKIVITADCVTGKGQPQIVYDPDRKTAGRVRGGTARAKTPLRRKSVG